MEKVTIEFFLDGISLGKFSCEERSNQDDRDLIAKNNGIMAFDKMVLDDGRVVMTRNNTCFVDNKGSIWNIIAK